MFIDTSSIITGAISFISALVLYKIGEKKSRLVYYVSNMSRFEIKPPGASSFKLFSHSLTIRNNGKAKAERVEISHSYFPENYDMVPQRPHEIRPFQNTKILYFDYLSSKESVTISYLYPAPIIPEQCYNYIKSQDGYAKKIEIVGSPRIPKIISIILMGLVVLGFITFIALLVRTFLGIFS